MAKQLLIESVSVNPSEIRATGGKYLVEATGNKLIVTLPVTKLNEKNLNGRTYSNSVMNTAIQRAKPAFERRELLSSVNEHPTEPYVTPGQASHVVIEAWNEGNLMYNKWEILETASGKDLRALVEAAVSFGVSIRGLGSVDYAGNILEDYEILGTDAVADPSAQLRVRPEIKNESISTPKTESIAPKEDKMKSTVLKHLNEQKILIESEIKSNKLSAYQRVIAVDNYLSETKLVGVDAAEVYTTWASIKESALGAITSEEKAKIEESAAKEADTAVLSKVLEKRNAQITAMAKAVNTLNEQLKATKTMAKVRGEKLQEAAIKKTNTTLAVLKQENAKLKREYEKALSETASLDLAYRLAVKEAAKLSVGYKLAVKEAASLAKGKKLIVKESTEDYNTAWEVIAKISVEEMAVEAELPDDEAAAEVIADKVREGNHNFEEEFVSAVKRLYPSAMVESKLTESTVYVPASRGGWTPKKDKAGKFAKAEAFQLASQLGGKPVQEGKLFMVVKESKETVVESKVIDNTKSTGIKEQVKESAYSRGEHKIPGWI
jgi:hypothetical protein